MMESIEKLREYTQDMRKRSVTPGHNPCADAVDGYLDEIEREIAERYMELPVDADGVPIHIGDNLHSDETKRGFPCRGYSLTLNGNSKWWTVECCYDSYSGTSEYVSAKSCHHVNPRTVEDVLREFAYRVCDLNVADCDIERYAEELRDLMGGDGR